ncbi:MAG: type III secretion system export apparatus subunit SctR [Wenzhouxiangella sp.]
MDLGAINPAVIIITVVSLALAPFVAVMVTSFTKIVIVLSLLRMALGLQQTPPNVVINGLALILSVYVMAPVLTASYQVVQEQQAEQGIEATEWDLDRLLLVAEAGKEPFREFLLQHARPSERQFFLSTAQRMLDEEQAESLSDTDFLVLIPAFTVSELTVAFQIGFLIFLPFLIIDLIVANILMALGMMMLSPTTISLPFKLLLFVFLDGWSKLVHGLVFTYM